MSLTKESKEADRLLWGKVEIGREIDRSPRQAAHLLAIGALPGAVKVGKRWVIPRARLRKAFSPEA